jgi:hypothetical protein
MTATDIVKQQYSYNTLLTKLLAEASLAAWLSQKRQPRLWRHRFFQNQENGENILANEKIEKMYNFLPPLATFSRYYNQYSGQYKDKLLGLVKPVVAEELILYYEYALEGIVVGAYLEGKTVKTAILYDFNLPGYIRTLLSGSNLDWEGVFGLIYQLMAMESGFAVWQPADADTDFCYGLGQYSADRFFDVLNGQLKQHIDLVKNVFKPLGAWLQIFDNRNVWEFWKFAGLLALMIAAASIAVSKGDSPVLPELGEEFYKLFMVTEKQGNKSVEILKIKAKLPGNKEQVLTNSNFKPTPVESFLRGIKNSTLSANQVAYLFYLTVAFEAAVMVYEKVALVKELLNKFNGSNYITKLDEQLGEGKDSKLLPLLVILSVGFNHVLPDLEKQWRDYLLNKASKQPGNMATNWSEIKSKIPPNVSKLKYIAALIGAELFNYTYLTYSSAKGDFERWLGEKNASNREYFLRLLDTINASGTDLGMLYLFGRPPKVNLRDLKDAIEILGTSFANMYKVLRGSFVFPFRVDVLKDGTIVLKDSRKDGKPAEIFRIAASKSALIIDLSPASITPDEADTTTERLIPQEALAKIKKDNPELAKMLEELLNTITHPFELPQEKIGLAYKSLITESQSEQKPVTVAEMHRGKIYTNSFESDG